MPERPPAVLVYPKDRLVDGRIIGLSALEELWFRRALDYDWLNDGLPSDPAEFAAWVGRDCTAEAAKKIIELFFVPHRKNPARVVNPGHQDQLKKLEKLRKAKSEAGKKGMASRWKQRAKSDNSVITADNIPFPSSLPSPPDPSGKNGVPPAAAAAAVADQQPEEGGEGDPVETRIWRDGVELCSRSKMADKQIRPFLGRMAKEYGKQRLAEAIAVTQAANPPDPKAYLVAVLQRRAEKAPAIKRDTYAKNEEFKAAPIEPCGVCGRLFCLKDHRFDEETANG